MRNAILALGFLALIAAPAAAQCADWAPDFARGGLVGGAAVTAAVYDDGTGPSLYVGGTMQGTDTVSSRCLVRWNGSEWSAVGNGLSGAVYALCVFDDGTGPALYVGGSFNNIGGPTLRNVARWDGQSWSAMGTFNGPVRDLIVFDDGSGPALCAGGSFTQWNGAPVSGVARWNGSAWTQVGSNAATTVSSLASFDDGGGARLYAGGSADSGLMAGGLARLDGGVWSAVGGGFSGGGAGLPGVWDMAVHDDGSGAALYLGGNFTSVGGQPMAWLTRWNGSTFSAVDGSPAGGFPSEAVFAVAVHDDGSGPALYIGGRFTQVAGVPARGVARWDGSSWSGLGSGVAQIIPSVSIVNHFVTYDDGTGPGLVVTGEFDTAGGKYTPSLARWRNGEWEGVDHEGDLRSNPGTHGELRGSADAFARFDDGSGEALYVGGRFDFAGRNPCRNVARWDGVEFVPLGSGITEESTFLRAVRALCVHDDGAGPALFAGGSFVDAGGVPVHHIARWDGASWSALGSGVSGTVSGSPTYPIVMALASYDDGSGPALYAAGNFTHAGGVLVNHIAKWDGSSWSPLGSGVGVFGGTPVSALAVYDDGGGPQLYVGGHIIDAGGVPSAYLARWNGTQWSAVGSGVWGDYGVDEVLALSVQDLGLGPKLFVGGHFAGAGGLSSTNLAVWDGVWSACVAQRGFSLGSVRGISAFDDGSGRGRALFVADGRVARYDGTAFEVVGGGFQYDEVGEPVTRALAVFDDGREPGADLYVAGTFGAAGTVRSHGIARWTSCGGIGELFCFGDGSAAACPCGNASAPADRAGCLNSFGTGGTLRARGRTSIGDDTLVLDGAEMTNSSALYYQAANVAFGGQGFAFGDGIKCTAGPFVRLRSKTNVGGMSSYPEPGDPSISVKGFVTAPGTRHYQVHYRNAAAFCTSDTFNHTNAVTVIWEL